MDSNVRKKGKSVTTSVPTIRFNASVEEIEEIYNSEDDVDEPNTKEATPVSEKGDSTSATTDPESSPLRSYLPRISKRSTSVDVSPSNTSQDASPPSDPWRFFTDIKGKITKSVEGKFTEYKKSTDEGSPKTLKPVVKDSKDNSSLSESEDFSESSISRTCGIISTTEGVEMSSDDETQSFSERDLASKSLNADSSASSPKKHNETIRIVSSKEDQITNIPMSDLQNLQSLSTGKPGEELDDVEDGVDVLVAGVTDSIENIKSSVDGLKYEPVLGEQLRETFVTEGEMDRTIFAPSGFVDMRYYPTSRKTTWKIYNYLMQSLVAIVLAVVIYYWMQFPSYITGFLMGVFATSLVAITYYIFWIRGMIVDDPKLDPKKMFQIPPVKEYAPITKFEGWINEYPDTYNPHIYHVSQTQSVYIKLQGNLLKVSHTRSKIPKRALWNEPVHKVALTHHRIYNLLGAKVMILPEGLARKRRWSKKYPIGIRLNPMQLRFSMAGTKSLKKKKKGSGLKSTISRDSSSSTPPDNSNSQSIEKTEDSKDALELMNSDEQLSFNPRYSLEVLFDNLEEKFITSDSSEVILMKKEVARNDEDLEEDLEVEWKGHDGLDEEEETHLYFFGRTDREKEDWFRRFTAATHHGACENITKEEDVTSNVSDQLLTDASLQEEYLQYMKIFHKARKASKKQECLEKDVNVGLQKEISTDMFWVNSILGRVLFDCMRDPEFTNKVKARIQRKLSAIKLPYFIDELIITELSLGNTPPMIHKAGSPIVDGRGLWIDLDLSYEGLVILTLLTKVNLLKLKDKPVPDNSKIIEQRNMAMFHSDVDDSAETSTDEDIQKLIASSNSKELPPALDDQGMPIRGLGGSSNASKKFIRIVDKIADSKVFKAASEYKYIKRLMEGVSNTDLGLKVEVKALVGTLVLNIPPPPSDRVWLGFRPLPKLLLTAFPMVGERNITFMHVTSWIEEKLIQEFQKILVVPNMEDVMIPIMTSNLPQ